MDSKLLDWMKSLQKYVEPEGREAQVLFVLFLRLDNGYSEETQEATSLRREENKRMGYPGAK